MNKINFKSFPITKQYKCPNCNCTKKCSKVKVVRLLKKYPLTEFYRKKTEKFEKNAFFDQKIFFCEKYNHAFLEKILDTNLIYKFYLTKSSSSYGAVLGLNSFYNFIKKNSKNLNKYNIVDIGGNDSTFLKMFKNNKEVKVNIDINAVSNNKKIIAVRKPIEKIEKTDIPFLKNYKIYVSSNILEHLSDPSLLVKFIAKISEEKDEIYFQFPCIEKMIELRKFDQICHQHINYFSLYSINSLLMKNNLYIWDYEYDTSFFGILRIKISKIKPKKLLKFKKQILYSKFKKSFSQFEEYYKILNKNIENTYKNGQGFGAGLMLPTAAYYLPVINTLKYILDENKQKINKKYLNLNPEIKSLKYFDKNKPVLITSISTQEAGRQIFKKLTNLGVKNITLPTYFS